MSIAVVERDETKTYSGLPSPDGWHVLGPWGDGLVWERLFGQRIKVIEDIGVKADGRKWLHISVSKPNAKLPTWEDLQEARRAFIGEDRECYQIFPPQERYVNLGNVLHLFCCLEQEKGVLPQFDGISSAACRKDTSMNTSHSAHESLWQRLRRHLTWLFTPPHATNWQPSKALGIQPVAMPEKPGLPPWAGRPLFEITPVSMPAVHPPLPLQEIARDKFEECGTNPKPGTFARLVDQAIRARTGEVPKLAQKPLPECETLPLADDPALQTIQDERPDVPLKPNPMALTGFAANLMAPSSNSDWLNSPLPRPDIWGEVEELAQKSGILPAIEPDTLEEANETEHSAAIRDIVKTRAATRAVRRRLNYMLPPLQPPHEREDK